MQITIQITLLVYLNLLWPDSIPAQCATLIQMRDVGVEDCVLPVIVETNQKLFPCVAPDEFMFDSVAGAYAYIDYVLHPGCSNICQTGLPVEITCYNLITGLENIFEGDPIRLFPTIATSSVTIEGKNINSVIIFNSNGIPVIQKNVFVPEAMDISELEPGIYFARLRTGASTIITKFIKIIN